MIPSSLSSTSFSITLPYKPFALSFSSPFAKESRLAICSFEQSTHNAIRVFRMIGPSIIHESEVNITLPQTCCMFSPNGHLKDDNDLLIVGGDTLKLFTTTMNGITINQEMNVNQDKEPLTSIDWSLIENSFIIVGSTDCTATAIDINTMQVATKIIAHDHPVHDLKFCGPSSAFTTAGFDGSLRLFDLRDLQTSLILYQAAKPLVRVSVSTLDPTKIVTFSRGSNIPIVLDSRKPGMAINISGDHHTEAITCVGWSKLGQNVFYTSDSSGSIHFNQVVDENFSEFSSHEFRNDNPLPIESFTVGNGMIAVAVNGRVDIINGPKFGMPI